MFKIIFFGAFIIAVTSANEIEQFNNGLEYGEPPLRGLAMPFPYQADREERVLLKPLYSDVLVPALPAAAAVGVTKLGLLAKVASTAVALVKKTFVLIIAHAPGLIIGSLIALGICKFTPFCDKFSGVKSLIEVPLQLRTYATPERLARATEFVKTAIRKYRSLQEN